MVNALAITDMIFTLRPMSSGNGKKVNSLPRRRKNGAPGGCGTPSMYELAINSPQSQNGTVGATVSKYTPSDKRKVIIPTNDNSGSRVKNDFNFSKFIVLLDNPLF